ncbi:MAG: hypothetical protein KatS3mg119_1225 [Rhodothalassiaceae bacterium]|nr:MAG: hypothetical protein KatS3mg119_1225 [Rhodothalassiaceae bacterium]
MVQHRASAIAAGDELARERAVLRRQLAGTNIDENSFLATDYLNHFNEVIMLLELAPDMPEALEEVRDWRPISYPEHFRRTGFRDKELAIAAYELAPPEVREAFDARSRELGERILETLAAVAPLAADGDAAALAAELQPRLEEIRALVSAINGIVHCGPGGIEEVGAVAAPGAGGDDAGEDADSISQADIDALFD